LATARGCRRARKRLHATTPQRRIGPGLIPCARALEASEAADRPPARRRREQVRLPGMPRFLATKVAQGFPAYGRRRRRRKCDDAVVQATPAAPLGGACTCIVKRAWGRFQRDRASWQAGSPQGTSPRTGRRSSALVPRHVPDAETARRAGWRIASTGSSRARAGASRARHHRGHQGWTARPAALIWKNDLVAVRRRRAGVQGWRYLDPDEAPRTSVAVPTADIVDMTRSSEKPLVEWDCCKTGLYTRRRCQSQSRPGSHRAARSAIEDGWIRATKAGDDYASS